MSLVWEGFINLAIGWSINFLEYIQVEYQVSYYSHFFVYSVKIPLPPSRTIVLLNYIYYKWKYETTIGFCTLNIWWLVYLAIHVADIRATLHCLQTIFVSLFWSIIWVKMSSQLIFWPVNDNLNSICFMTWTEAYGVNLVLKCDQPTCLFVQVPNLAEHWLVITSNTKLFQVEVQGHINQSIRIFLKGASQGTTCWVYRKDEISLAQVSYLRPGIAGESRPPNSPLDLRLRHFV